MNNRMLLGAAVVVVTVAIMAGFVFDFDTMSMRHLANRETKKVIGIAAAAIVILIYVMSNDLGKGPHPPRHP